MNVLKLVFGFYNNELSKYIAAHLDLIWANIFGQEIRYYWLHRLSNIEQGLGAMTVAM